jgi:hypothetical protein
MEISKSPYQMDGVSAVAQLALSGIGPFQLVISKRNYAQKEEKNRKITEVRSKSFE